jgi:SAM-dependent methyltransferase/GNAT superfamily N-acetyltransferase
MSEPVLAITAVDPRSAEAVELVRALSDELAQRYDFTDDGAGNFKPEDVLVPRSAFVLGRAGVRAVACGALRPLEGDVCEIKRMFVVPDCRGRGYSRAILAELERLAASMGYTTARLETANRQPEAIGLYERAGYRRIANFGIYVNSERSVCFEKQLGARGGPSRESKPGQARRKGSYGIDAPYLLPILALLIVANVVSGIVSGTVWPFLGAAAVLASAGCGLYTSQRGKFVVWAGLLERLHLRGDERILDLGCGRGAVLLLAARHLTTGRAVGVDVWRRWDQSGNAPEATLRNAAAEGVADRVEVHTADMTALPFADGSFDVVVSNVAIHNIKGRAGREKAIEEAVRVLRPGGRLLIADLWATRLYRAHLAKLGMIDVGRRGLGWRMWWSGPWLPTRLVTATKPKPHN